MGSKEEFQEVAFPLEPRKKINLSLPPQDGNDYLHRVIIEKNSIDEVVTVSPKKSKRNYIQTPISLIEYTSTLPQELIPTKEWKQLQVGNFRRVRDLMTYLRTSSHHKKPNNLPSKNENEKWRKYCFGDKEAEPHLPTVSIMFSMNQNVLLSLLELHIEWLTEDNDLTLLAGRWLYALLACLDEPLLPDAHDLIRKLARTCGNIRAKLKDPNIESVAPTTLFICLVANYFKQLDLEDKTESDSTVS